MAKMKTPTPQELYRARRQREEQEKLAYLPPGLINHGNTCFMNSVLQGLIATRLLNDLAHFNAISPSIQQHSSTTLSSRRSPLLTNGHRLGGEFEQGWVDSMPIGDVFLDTMLKAFNSQERQARESLSPKLLLSVLGRKYDQYLDFAQQDAHEFLRILLDATRMEELDVIKKRQPPPEPVKKRRRTTITSSCVSEPLPSVSDEDKLMSLSDMIFGGKLTSILVCQKCKHISQTYEDFNDISLSIKAEDYQERKRDRFKNLAKRLTSFPTSTASLSVSSEPPRSSSVPPSPKERESTQLGGNDDTPIVDEVRRRSLDFLADTAQDADSERSTTASNEDVAMTESDGSAVLINGVAVNVMKHVEISMPVKPEKKDKKDKKDDNWTKISKRISMTVGLGKVSHKERSSRSRDRTSRDLSQVDSALANHSNEDSTLIDPTSAKSTPRTSTAETSLSGLSATSTRLSGHDSIPHPRTPSPTSSHHHSQVRRGKSPKPPKPTSGELNYLREILADITPASSNNPFVLFKPPYLQHNGSNRSVTGSTAAAAQNLWLNMNHFSGIEECLRMFTSVEILDGENMVGCRRCWKIANGVYQKSPNQAANADDDSDSAGRGSLDSLPPGIPLIIAQPRPTLSPLSPPLLAHLPTSLSTPTVSFYTQPENTDNRSVSSLPAEPSPLPDSEDSSASTLVPVGKRSTSGDKPSTPGGLPIPFISTTGPDSPTSHVHPPHPDPPSTDSDATPTPPHVPRLGQVLSHFPPPPPPPPKHPSPPSNSPSSSNPNSTTDSLPLPLPKYRRQHPKSDLDTDESSGESETSAATSVHSLDSSAPPQPRPKPKPKLPKPVIMRPAYKRYLIGVPPPVLVIHLKRFQHLPTSKHMLSFSHGFKKLDDYVTFPEFLDLTPYLAPKKEDFGLGRRRRGEKDKELHGEIDKEGKEGTGGKEGGKDGKEKKHNQKEKCMYRLYAVVVHIGNMLGGHYIAYTALPDPRSPEDTEKSDAHKHPHPHPHGHGHGHDHENKPPRQWAYVSDTVVRLTTLEEVLKAKAYLCMYERI
ncbi:Ubiquitin carboxyl-terminal hydrolase 45 [Hypsizygus marmoreus]|uniref:ubiquitinyl hydrolase 1 n=1 Tax=Hypsizygus marmoreus TaxID=39966 RepID=A0A369JYY5_HYPMA|nr:Ubiquitin carboxyl-terminal hydrolase 45 [Hypsizygus marmoreus]